MSVGPPTQEGSGGFFMSARRIVIYDTTLRDGAQGPAVSFSAADKERVARLLDGLGFDYVEGGFPGSNPKDEELFANLAEQPLGHSRPAALEQGVDAVRKALAGIGSQTRVGIHTHNDCELAVANSLAGVMAGADMVQGTINGYGERCGNANLVSVVSNLVLKLGLDALPQTSVERFSELSRTVAEIANLALPLQQPFLVHGAVAHMGRHHVAALLRHQGAYQHTDLGPV